MIRGVEKGREEGILEVARNLLKLGMSREAIAQATGLDLTTLQKL
jgi:predicted transposase/invertase (TIGR01784 family)